LGTRKKDIIMGILAKSLTGLGFVAAMALATPSPTFAQGIYFEGPGVEFGIGRPYHRYYHYYNYDRPRVYVRPYWRDRYYRRGWDWD
jgi:hypothetical protein